VIKRKAGSKTIKSETFILTQRTTLKSKENIIKEIKKGQKEV
jgi:hypothetical protein